ncbi:hypothetical protein D7B24_007776 [Verticillium nonalfalfae]|uniref:Uncharacterized protein n=1 Tax=Verticillium nonalfalfae TaxID=1051616 RepID=A0A3M9Y6A1_9PEZI|nr:uncharacterized protein D7B24_007776 [Verticillium nonalfalfae]RNJ55997.1 hypothetical protein D7B24_007776 [Verticillium nonalfalfae]
MQWADTRALRPLVSSIAVARMPPRTPGLPLGLLRPLSRSWPNHRPLHAAALRGSPSRKGKTSIFKEMFPDASAGHEIPRTDRPRRPRDDILAKEPPIQRELPGKDDLRAWLEAQSHGEEGINARPEKDEMPAMLILSNASKHLTEADFYRIGRKGEHLQGWNTTIKKVIHLHDRNTLAPLDSYFILFTSRAAARAYQREAEQLYSRARADAAKQDLTPAPPADDIPPFTLAPPSPAPLNLKLYALPPSTAARLGAFTLAKTLPAPEKSVEGAQRVVVSLQGGALPPAAFWGLVRRDGEERNLAWDVLEMQPYFAQKAASSSASHRNSNTPRDKTKNKKKEKQEQTAAESTAETQTAEQRAAGETATTDAPASDEPKDKTHAKSARFVLSFRDVHEARRFARSWHRREFPLSPPRQGRDKGRVGQCVTASVAVPW